MIRCLDGNMDRCNAHALEHQMMYTDKRSTLYFSPQLVVGNRVANQFAHFVALIINFAR